jgi:peptidoglycan/LPS O-acetylase OafA/YrhL
LPVFCLGAVLFFLLVAKMEHGDLFEGIGKPRQAMLLLCAGAFFMLVGIPTHLRFAIAFVLIAWGLAIRTMKLLVNRASRFVGQVSYSVYLWHFWILDRVSPHVLGWVGGSGSAPLSRLISFAAVFIAAISLSLAVAGGSYYLIEEPGQQLGKRIIESMGWGSVTGQGVV